MTALLSVFFSFSFGRLCLLKAWPKQYPTAHPEHGSSGPVDCQTYRFEGERKKRTDLHLKSLAAVTEVFSNKHSALLANKESCGIYVLLSAAILCVERREYSQVLQPTLSGQIERSATLRFLTPWTLRRSSSTPCLTMLLPSLGAMEQVYVLSVSSNNIGDRARKE